ncbi:polyphosphate kinase 2 [Weeksellaceae bacterium TAE3-ERU29]|nr:polyphosphate kinase 2 [Weeksellaceae bacterium TAE3-ERU29]
MGEFNIKDLEQIRNTEEIMDMLIKKGVIKEKKFLKQLEYEKCLATLQKELINLQTFMLENGKRLLVIFEGRDAAGKGGAIKRLRMNLNPRNYRVVALTKPTDNEKGQWYFQRYIKHLPTAGEMVFFDRSWYNRAVVEPVFGFCTEEEHNHFMEQVPNLEKLLIDDGIILIKIFLEISKEEQKERLDDRAEDPLKKWKLGPLDKQAQEKWGDYTKYIEKMLKKTGTEKSPWVVVKTDDKKTARLEIIKYILKNIPDFETNLDLKIDKEVINIKD